MYWRGKHHPLVPVTLRSAGISTTTYGILDSGADSTLFHASLACDLGIDVTQGVSTEIFGINPDEPIEAFTHAVGVEVGGIDLGVVEVDFSEDIDDDWIDQLIGRHMVFDRLRIGFRQALQDGWVYLGPESVAHQRR